MHIVDVKNLHCITCGESFRSKAALARHKQKWNTKSDLRDKTLTRKVK